MSPRTKQRIGGGMILLVVGFLSKEVISWLIGHGLDMLVGGLATVNLAAFPWENLILTATGLLGAYLAFWPDSRTRQMRDLADRASSIAERVRAHRMAIDTRAELDDPLAGIVADASSLLLSFAKQGFAVPALREADLRGMAFGAARYLRALAPLLRDGHWKEARAASRNFAARAEEEA